MRPALITDIDNVVANADLLDRVVSIDLPRIRDLRFSVELSYRDRHG